MDKIVIAISTGGNTVKKPATSEEKNMAYKKAIDQFTTSKGDVDVDTLRNILKAISTLLEAKENDATGMDENFYEQTEPKKQANNLFR